MGKKTAMHDALRSIAAWKTYSLQRRPGVALVVGAARAAHHTLTLDWRVLTLCLRKGGAALVLRMWRVWLRCRVGDVCFTVATGGSVIILAHLGRALVSPLKMGVKKLWSEGAGGPLFAKKFC